MRKMFYCPHAGYLKIITFYLGDIMSVLTCAMSSCYKYLDKITEPAHPYYHHFQLTLVAGITYFSTSLLTSIPPERAMTFGVVAYSVHQLMQDIIINFIPTTKGNTLALRGKQILHLCSTLIISKLVCQVLRENLSFYECIHVTALFLLAIYIPIEAHRRFSKILKH